MLASPFHAGPTTDPCVLLARAPRCGPRRLMYCARGDFVTVAPEEIDWLAAELGRIPALLTVSVLGNHDCWSDPSRTFRLS